MTGKMIALEFVVPTVLALALGIGLSVGAVYLADHFLFAADPFDTDYTTARSR